MTRHERDETERVEAFLRQIAQTDEIPTRIIASASRFAGHVPAAGRTRLSETDGGHDPDDFGAFAAHQHRTMTAALGPGMN